jgi:hypothetical protein
MQLTDPQRRTLERLIGGGERPVVPMDLAQRLRDRVEDAVRGLELREQLWLGKERLHDASRCEGLLASQLAGEAPAFAHTPRTAGGVLAHKAVEVDMSARDVLDPQTAAEVAMQRLVQREERFAEHWSLLSTAEQDETLMEAARRLTLFRASFPPIRELRRSLAPISELRVRAELLGGDLVLSGQIDLVLGMPDPAEPLRAHKLAIDLKTGDARPEFAEDMRLYALLLTLRFGVPPYRVASLFLASMSACCSTPRIESSPPPAPRPVCSAGATRPWWLGRGAAGALVPPSVPPP